MAKQNQALEAALDQRNPASAPITERTIHTAPKAANTAPAGMPSKAKKALPEARLALQGYLHNSWDATVERGTNLEEVLDADFWKHIAVKLRPHDTLHVLCEDGSWYARLLVISADRLWARVFKLEYHDLTASYENMPKTMEEEYEVTWTVTGKYGLKKKGNSGMPVLKDGFATKLEAYQWLDGHLKALNG